MLFLQFGGPFDRVVLVDVLDDLLDRQPIVAQLLQGRGHSAVDDFHHAAAGQLLVLDQRDVRFDARGVAIHHEGDRAGGGQHGGLGVAVTVLPARFDTFVPNLPGCIAEVIRAGRMDVVGGVAVLAHHTEHRLFVLLVALERSDVTGDAAGREIRLAGQDGRQGAADPPAGIAVVRDAQRHQQAAQVGVTESQRAIDVAVLGNGRHRIAGVIDEDFLSDDENRRRPAEPQDVERPVLFAELLQVQAGQVARRVVQEHVLGTRVRRVDSPGTWAGVPVVDGRVVLHAGIAAVPGSVGDLTHQVAGLVFRTGDRGVGDPVRLPGAIVGDRLHELVADANREVRVLKHDGAVGFAVEVDLILAAVDENTRLLLLLRLGLDELQHVGMPVFDALHLGGPARLAAGFDDRGNLVVDPHERQRPRGNPPAGELLSRTAKARQIGPGARAELEQHRLARRQAHDVFHVVFDRLDETSRALRKLVRRLRAADGVRFGVPVVVAPRTLHAVLMIQTDVEPHRRVKRTVLVQAEPGQLAVEAFAVVGRLEVAVLYAPIGDGPGDAVNDLPDARFPLRCSRLAVKILADDHVGRQRGPRGRDLAVLLLEQDVARFVLDACGAQLPIDRVERVHVGRAKKRCDFHRGGLGKLLSVLPFRLACAGLRQHSLRVMHHAPPGLNSFSSILTQPRANIDTFSPFSGQKNRKMAGKSVRY